MHNKINLQKFLLEQKKMSKLTEADLPPLGAQPDMGAGMPPMTQPGTPGDPMNQQPPTQMTVDDQPGEDDISNDPAFPDMPEEQESDHFTVWKMKYVKESIKGDPNTLIQKILDVRDRSLDAADRRFVEDNLDINFLRQNANILEVSNEIRKLIKKEFDRTNPATSVVKHITDTLQKKPLLNEIFVKLLGCGGAKGEYHRKFIASLIGAVQIGGGGETADIVFEEQDYSIPISTRFNSRWGDVNLGHWTLFEDEPERHLKKEELSRLEGGSPEEKDVLRRRVIIESIAKAFNERAIIINVVAEDGTVHHLGWDLGNSLRSAYLDGKLVVRTQEDDTKKAFIDEDGSVISIPNMSIYYVKESGQINERGKPEIEEIEFISYRKENLYLSANLDLIKEAAVTLQGIILRETLWQGNPTDLLKVMRCVPSLPEIILRQC